MFESSHLNIYLHGILKMILRIHLYLNIKIIHISKCQFPKFNNYLKKLLIFDGEKKSYTVINVSGEFIKILKNLKRYLRNECQN